MRFVARPTVAEMPDGALVIRKEGFTPSDAVEVVGILCLLAGAVTMFAMPWAYGELVTGRVFQIGLGILSLLMLGFVGVLEGVTFHLRGTWRVDAAGVTHRDAAGLDRRVAWGEVDRVWWTGRTIRLVTPREAVTLTVNNPVAPAWQGLLARVEAALSPRFDLAIREAPREPLRLGRVLLLLVPVGLLAGAFVRFAPLLSDRQLRELGLGLLILTFFGKIAGIGWITIVRADRLNPRWRLPRRGEEGVAPDLAGASR